MKKFLVKEDINFFGSTVLYKDQIIEIDNFYNVDEQGMKFQIPIENILEDKRFQELKEQNLIFDIQEISDDEDLEVKKYRIQLDVLTNRKKLREIENFMRKTLENML
jgi:hypothetical protein